MYAAHVLVPDQGEPLAARWSHAVFTVSQGSDTVPVVTPLIIWLFRNRIESFRGLAILEARLFSKDSS